MIRLALLRHAATSWTAERRIQGRSDIPLSDEGRAQAAGWRLPPDLRSVDWYTSPLARARETAALIVKGTVTVEPRLAEMHWGAWEGRTLGELRREFGAGPVDRNRLGFDFRPPGGESPRELLARVSSWLAEVTARGRPVAAVTHRGVLRVLYAGAVGWDMRDEPSEPLRDDTLHLFDCDADGSVRLVGLNMPLVAASAKAAP